MASVSILIRAKNEASATFNRVKGDIKDFSNDSQKAMAGVNAAQDAMAKAMRGDLVGAAQSAAAAFKALWAVVISNPILAGIAAAVAAVAALVTWHNKAAEAAAAHKKAVSDLNSEMAGIAGQSPADVRKEIAGKMTEGELVARQKYAMDEAEHLKQQAEVAGQRKIQGAGWRKIDGQIRYKSQGALDREAEEAIDAYKQAQQAIDIYGAALDERRKKKTAAAEAAKKEAEETAKAEALAREVAAKNEADKAQAIYETQQSIAELNAKARSQELQDQADHQKKLIAGFKEASDKRIEAAKEEASRLKDVAEKAGEKAAAARFAWLNPKEAAKEKDDADKAANREARLMQSAREKAAKGIRGKHIDAAKAAWEAERDARKAGVVAVQADKSLEGLQQSANNHLAQMETFLDSIESSIKDALKPA